MMCYSIEKKTRGKVSGGLGFGSGILIFAAVFAVSVGMAVWLAQTPSVVASKETSLLAQLAVVTISLVLAASLVSWAEPNYLRRCVVPSESSSRLVAWCGCSLVAGLGFGLLGAKLSGGKSGLSLTEVNGGLGLLSAASMNLVLTPIFEEVLFRGVLFSALRQRLSFVPAALLSGFAFGIAHLAPTAEGAVLVGAGFWFAWLFDSTQSLVPCMIGHAAMNYMYGVS